MDYQLIDVYEKTNYNASSDMYLFCKDVAGRTLTLRVEDHHPSLVSTYLPDLECFDDAGITSTEPCSGRSILYYSTHNKGLHRLYFENGFKRAVFKKRLLEQGLGQAYNNRPVVMDFLIETSLKLSHWLTVRGHAPPRSSGEVLTVRKRDVSLSVDQDKTANLKTLIFDIEALPFENKFPSASEAYAFTGDDYLGDPVTEAPIVLPT